MLRRAFVLAVALLGFAVVACGQTTVAVHTPADTTLEKDWITVNLGIILDPARKELQAAWTDDPRQVERAYCVGMVRWRVAWAYDSAGRRLGREVLAIVSLVDTAETEGATPTRIAKIDCPANMVELHTHPPTTCTDRDDPSSCSYGGIYAFQCQPSREDYLSLISSGDPFGIIQCGREEFRFYWPQDYRP